MYKRQLLLSAPSGEWAVTAAGRVTAQAEQDGRVCTRQELEETFEMCIRDRKEGDRVSVRGEGRFLVDALGPPTKKGRLFVTVKKYR